jgi:hypothetical protein
MFRLARWYAGALVRRPGFAAKQLAATACWIRSSEELLGDERPAIAHAYERATEWHTRRPAL